MKKTAVFILILCTGAAILLAGCEGQHRLTSARPAGAQAPVDTSGQPLDVASANILPPSGPDVRRQTDCPVPQGWVFYRVAFNETIFSIAARGSVGVSDLLAGNCLAALPKLDAGVWLSVPAQAAAMLPQTFLPLGVGALVANPASVPAGGYVTLAWQAQGPVVNVRIGWMYGNSFVQEAGGLPSSGIWSLRVPDDGRNSITYVVLASDGVREVAAQTTVRIACGEGWFFSPVPAGCPLPALSTTFYEQSFERGSIIYVPALRVHYLLIQGRTARAVEDRFVPGMPLTDPALDAAIPVGLQQPRGPINLAWRSNPRLQAALGYAVGAARPYTGMHQRTVSAGGETIYFASSRRAR